MEVLSAAYSTVSGTASMVGGAGSRLVAAKDSLLQLASRDTAAQLSTKLMHKTDDALNLVKRQGSLPAPVGTWEVGYVDIMTHGLPSESSFIRLYYPTQQKHEMLPDRCPIWTEHDTKHGFINFLHCMVQRWPSWVNNTEFNLLGVIQGVNNLAGWAFKPLFSLGWGLLANHPRIPVIHQAQLANPKQGKAWPVVVFSHGMGCNRYAYSKVCYDLSSEGCVVAAVEHRDGSACHSSYFKDGQLTKIPHVALSSTEDEYAARNKQVNRRAEELSRALDLVNSLNEGVAPVNQLPAEAGHSLKAFSGMLDVRQAYLVGHSFGGSSVLLAASKDDRFKGTVAIDPWMFPVSEENFSVTKPVLMINTELFINDENLNKVKSVCRELSASVLEGAVHLVHTDAPLLFDNDLIKSGLGMACSRSTEQVLLENHTTITAWLNKKLQEQQHKNAVALKTTSPGVTTATPKQKRPKKQLVTK